MPTLAQARNRVDNWFTDPLIILGNRSRWQYISSRQTAFFNNNNRYWQGLRTHTVEIDYANDSTLEERLADNFQQRPSNETARWIDVIPALDSVSMPVRLVMDVYENEDGHGWVLRLFVRFNGIIYTRSQNGAGTGDMTRNWDVYDPTLDQ